MTEPFHDFAGALLAFALITLLWIFKGRTSAKRSRSAPVCAPDSLSKTSSRPYFDADTTSGIIARDRRHLQRMRRLAEAWQRYHRVLLACWQQIEENSTTFGMSACDERFLPPGRVDLENIQQFNLMRLQPEPDLKNRGRIEDIIGLLSPVSFEQMRFIRWHGDSPQRFNLTLARLYAARKSQNKGVAKLWAMRGMESDQQCYCMHFSVPLPCDVLSASQCEKIIAAHRLTLDVSTIQQWDQLSNILNRVERGDYSTELIPAIDMRLSYALIAKSIAEETWPSERSILNALSHMTPLEKASHALDAFAASGFSFQTLQ